ncbi:MAG: hypothetical protein WD904_00955 [Dehalococcoidia bacterium]
MRTTLCLLVIATLLFLVACGDDDDTTDTGSSATPSPAASVPSTSEADEATPTPPKDAEPTDLPELTSFATFAQQIDTAVQQQDANFFSNLGVETTITCTGNEGGGPCEGMPANFTITGIPGVAWMSDAGGYTPIAAYNTLIAQWFAAAMPAQTDSYGNGVPRLHAIAADSTQGDHYAIVTLILDLGPPTGIQRQARAFRFAPDTSGGFELTGEVLAAASSTADEWLSGQCTSCYYDSFQTWP